MMPMMKPGGDQDLVDDWARRQPRLHEKCGIYVPPGKCSCASPRHWKPSTNHWDDCKLRSAKISRKCIRAPPSSPCSALNDVPRGISTTRGSGGMHGAPILTRSVRNMIVNCAMTGNPPPRSDSRHRRDSRSDLRARKSESQHLHHQAAHQIVEQVSATPHGKPLAPPSWENALERDEEEPEKARSGQTNPTRKNGGRVRHQCGGFRSAQQTGEHITTTPVVPRIFRAATPD